MFRRNDPLGDCQGYRGEVERPEGRGEESVHGRLECGETRLTSEGEGGNTKATKIWALFQSL